MHKQQQVERRGMLLLMALSTIVLAFMGLSLAITATGTARFAVAMGYPSEVGYAIGGVFDVAKAVLPIALLTLLARRAFLFFAIIGSAWIGLVTYSGLATHATVSTAIASIERTGTWQMEGRTNIKAELASVEQQLAALSQPKPPKPIVTVREALAAARVPPNVWKDSQECASIRDSRYFERACAAVVALRKELAAAEDYQQLDDRARELRQALAAAPLVAISDPLPEAFAATLGRLVPLDGRVGVALLLTLVIEIMSCFGLAALRVLREEKKREPTAAALPEAVRDDVVDVAGEGSLVTNKLFPVRLDRVFPSSSLGPATGSTTACGEGREQSRKDPSNVLPLPARSAREEGAKGASLKPAATSGTVLPFVGSHVPAFVADCLVEAHGMSLAAADIRSAYEAWCAANGYEPLSQQKLSAELLRLGYSKWKSCGLIRYRGLQLVA